MAYMPAKEENTLDVFKCGQCDRSFLDLRRLALHQETVHSKTKRFVFQIVMKSTETFAKWCWIFCYNQRGICNEPFMHQARNKKDNYFHSFNFLNVTILANCPMHDYDQKIDFS